MVGTLPRNVQLKLEQTLSQWHNWQCKPSLTEKPTVAKRLSRGLSNYSFLVSSGDLYVIRIDGVNPAIIGLSRQTEWRAMASASAAGLAPCPRYYNPELNSLVYDYLTEDPVPVTDPAATASLLQAIHQLPPVHFRLDLPERVRRYEKHMQHQGTPLHPVLDSCRTEILRILDTVSSEEQCPVFCHNDLLRANRLSCGGSLRAIDWEYCAMGSRWFDLAVVTVGDGLNQESRETLLTAYLDRAACDEERQRLSNYEIVYRYIELLWFNALDSDSDSERALGLSDARLQALEKGLPSSGR
ncbi:MAG: phosphotransferase [Halioglobus sp.]